VSVIHAPWHTLTVTQVWYCVQGDPDAADMPCRDEDGWCTGHSEAASGLRLEVEHDLTHPADCESLPDFLDCLTADMVCNEKSGDLPAFPGVYRVRAWMDVPRGPFEGSGAGFECVAGLTGGSL